MTPRRTVALVVAALAGLGAAACGSATSSTATNGGSSAAPSGASAPTAPAAIGSASAGLCREVATVTAQQQGLATAARATGTTPASVTALQAYARKTKVAFDQVAPRVTADLGSAPRVVQSAWSTLQPQIDQLLVAGESATTVEAFTRSAAAVQSSNAYVAASQTLSAFTHGACRTALPS